MTERFALAPNQVEVQAAAIVARDPRGPLLQPPARDRRLDRRYAVPVIPYYLLLGAGTLTLFWHRQAATTALLAVPTREPLDVARA